MTVFNNFGFFAYLVIIVVTYMRGVELKAGEQLALMSMLFFLFMSVNGVTIFALNTIFQFLALTVRLGDVFKLEEHVSTL